VRALVLKRAPGLGFGAAEQSFDLAELSRADAIFATSSLKLIAPCGSLERHAFASAENEVVHTLQAALRDAIEAECGTT